MRSDLVEQAWAHAPKRGDSPTLAPLWGDNPGIGRIFGDVVTFLWRPGGEAALPPEQIPEKLQQLHQLVLSREIGRATVDRWAAKTPAPGTHAAAVVFGAFTKKGT